MPVRGVRGATTAEMNSRRAVLDATLELLEEMARANNIRAEELASALFTVTPDLNAGFPARAARMLGWTDVPLLGAQEQAVPGALERCIRVLLHWNTDLPQASIHHVYLREAEQLRSDLGA